ncbi:MAG: hypothetical protein IJZ85_04390 [Lachnospiraceae bacterium]|nr:hypothetical protein [Lachnospiraceae bacterium]
MKKILTIEEGVRSVLSVYNAVPDIKWEYRPAEEGCLTDAIVLDGAVYPLFWWRCDTQIMALAENAPERKLCSMKLNRTCAKSYGIDRLMYQEIDIAELMLDSKIESVMCFDNGCARNMLATMKNKRVAIFELAAVLNDCTAEQGRHIYWGQDGMASDRVVSQKVASDAIYLFSEDEAKPEVFNDIFIYMYGLNKTDVVKAACIAEILMGWRDISDWKEKDAHYRRCLAAAAESDRTCRRTLIREAEV